MIWLEIGMVLIGMAAVIYGVRMADQAPKQNETAKKAADVIDIDLTEQMDRQLADYRQRAENMAADTELQTGDRLKELSNESILGIQEYSDQVLDKIEKNHAEVVFLYNMLQEKQEELKGIIKDADKTKAELRDEMAVQYQQNQERLAGALAGAKDERQKSADTPDRSSRNSNADIVFAVTEDEEAELLPEWPETETAEHSEEDFEEVDGFVRKEEILDLYRKGHSVLEISKMLSMGQGEVKFVIDVYGKR